MSAIDPYAETIDGYDPTNIILFILVWRRTEPKIKFEFPKGGVLYGDSKPDPATETIAYLLEILPLHFVKRYT